MAKGNGVSVKAAGKSAAKIPAKEAARAAPAETVKVAAKAASAGKAANAAAPVVAPAAAPAPTRAPETVAKPARNNSARAPSSVATHIVTTPPSRQEVEQLAYQLFEVEGRPHGRELDHWLRAEAALLEGRRPKG